MPSYAVLGNYTEQGIQNMKELPARLQGAKDAIQAAGGRMIFFYLTLGPHDFVTVVEAPDAESAARTLLAIGADGNIRTTTMHAFTEEEAAAVVAGLP
jgi:uncharacterized protein with GYD domain